MKFSTVSPGIFVWLLIILFCFNATQTHGQWSPDPGLNLRICDVTGEQGLPKIGNTSDGGAYICWFDTRSGQYAVYLQRLDSLGMKQFPDDGLLISSHPQNSWLVDYDMAVDASDNAIIVFTDIRNGGDFNPFAYKISPSGSFVWGADGITLSDSFAVFQPNPKVAVAGDGDAVITWIYGSTPSQVAMQRISPEGIKRWGSQGIFLSGTGNEQLYYPALVASDSASVILLWSGYTGSFLNPGNYHLYTQKFSPAGSPLWSPVPDTVYALGRVPGFFVPKIASDGANGALYVWHDDRNMTNLSTSYVQHFTSAGEPMFPVNGSAVSTLSPRNHFDAMAAYVPSTGETFCAWNETNALQTQTGLYGQKFSPSGTRMWTDAGRAFVDLSDNGYAYISVSARDTFALISWTEQIFGSVSNPIRCLKSDGHGLLQWGDSSRTVSNAQGEKLHMEVTLDGRGVLKLAWSDRRTDGGGIYAQNLNFDGSLGNPPVGVAEGKELPASFSLLQNYPNPFNPSTSISFDIPVGTYGPASPAGRRTSLQVYDLLGREVATLVNEPKEPGRYTVQFNGSGLASGVYYYRLQAGTFTATRKLLLLR